MCTQIKMTDWPTNQVNNGSFYSDCILIFVLSVVLVEVWITLCQCVSILKPHELSALRREIREQNII